MKKRLLRILIIFCAIIAVFAGFVVWRVSQPRYRFLSGLTPTFAGDPMPQFDALGRGAGAPTPPPKGIYFEVYSLNGSYEGWREKIDREMRLLGVKRRDQGEQMGQRTSDWLIDGKEPDMMASAEDSRRAIAVIENTRHVAGQNLFTSFLETGKAKGWTTIIVFEKRKPTFFTRLADFWDSAMKKLSGGP